MSKTHAMIALAAVTLLALGCMTTQENDGLPNDLDVAASRSKRDAGRDREVRGQVADREDAAPPEPRPVRWLANIGDSISQGYDADDAEPIDLNALSSTPDAVFGDAPSLSWVQGTDSRIGSVAWRLKSRQPDLRVTPFSRTGAEVVGRAGGISNFEDQARALASEGAEPDLVYVLLGGNDVCGRPSSGEGDATATLYSVDRWRQGLTAGLTVLATTLPERATVRVLSMPRVDLLYDAAGDSAVPVTLMVDTSFGPVRVASSRTCKELWGLAALARPNGICSIVTRERSDARRAAIGRRIDAYNDALAAEVRRFRDDSQLNPRRIFFQTDWAGSLASGARAGGSMGTFAFDRVHVSRRDCFHPSVAGQREIAKLAMERATWAP
jgi:lysophospholipase L1-like esterase